jgi:uncharacterized protein YlxW (UPF0749 family)
VSSPVDRRDRAQQLLEDITFNPLDPGYYRAQTPGRRRWTPPFLGLLVAVAGLGLLVGAAVDVLRSVPSASAERVVLQEEIERRTAAADEIAAANLATRERIAELEISALPGDGGALEGAVERLGLAAGAVPVTGPGVRITLDDPVRSDDELFAGDDREDVARVLDFDVQQVVNGLWATGAEAIAINGVRLTSLSPIRGAGTAILVDYRPLARPYVVEAVGDSDAMAADLSAGSSGAFLVGLRENYGVQVSVALADELELTASSSPLEPDHARPYRPEPVGAAADPAESGPPEGSAE